MGIPFGVNVKNLIWHGFISSGEFGSISVYASFLILVLLSLYPVATKAALAVQTMKLEDLGKNSISGNAEQCDVPIQLSSIPEKLNQPGVPVFLQKPRNLQNMLVFRNQNEGINVDPDKQQHAYDGDMDAEVMTVLQHSDLIHPSRFSIWKEAFRYYAVHRKTRNQVANKDDFAGTCNLPVLTCDVITYF